MFTLKNHYECLFFISLIEGKQNDLDYVFCCCYVVITENNNETEIVMTLKPCKSSRTGRYRNIKNNPKSYKNDSNSPPRVIWHQFWKPHFPWDI